MIMVNHPFTFHTIARSPSGKWTAENYNETHWLSVDKHRNVIRWLEDDLLQCPDFDAWLITARPAID